MAATKNGGRNSSYGDSNPFFALVLQINADYSSRSSWFGQAGHCSQ